MFYTLTIARHRGLINLRTDTLHQLNLNEVEARITKAWNIYDDSLIITVSDDERRKQFTCTTDTHMGIASFTTTDREDTLYKLYESMGIPYVAPKLTHSRVYNQLNTLEAITNAITRHMSRPLSELIDDESFKTYKD